jgi:hypothetical protein
MLVSIDVEACNSVFGVDEQGKAPESSGSRLREIQGGMSSKRAKSPLNNDCTDVASLPYELSYGLSGQISG